VTADERARRTAEADALCAKAWDDVGGPDTGLALVAVGGYGRGELAPYSDLDVVLVSDAGLDIGGTGADDQLLRRVAEQVWYPLWDSGANIDHSVRSLSEMA
jgi:[protein-PII] uridylyltransferase